jgi:PKD repeat protein
MKALHIVLTVLLIASGTGIASATNINDLDGDGLYEDLNGNGRLDFDDVVCLFENFDILGAHPLIAACFDFNHNGRLDFADVVALFNAL